MSENEPQNGADFAQALIVGWLQQPAERLQGFTQILERRPSEHQRLRIVSAVYTGGRHLHGAAQERLTEVPMQGEPVEVPLLRRESRVKVAESSSVLLPPELACRWRGCGGSAGRSEAASKRLVRWDVWSGKLEGPRLTDGRPRDNKSPASDEDLPPGGLDLAARGFFADVPAVPLSTPTHRRPTLCA